MNILKDFSIGVFSVLKTLGAPMLYRYPYRNAGEAFVSDWQRISEDIESVLGHLKRESSHE